MRTLIDRAGISWDVYEVYPSAERQAASRVPDQYRNGWLCFQNAVERRRLAPIPLGWQEWDERSLRNALVSGAAFPRRTPRVSETIDDRGSRPGPRA